MFESIAGEAFTVILISTIAALICSYVYWVLKTRRLYSLASKIPYPKGFSRLPIIGHAHHFLGTVEENLNNVIKFSEGPDPVYQGRILHKVCFLTTCPKAYDIILNSSSCLEKSELYKWFSAALGDGLLSCGAEKWKRIRKLISPTFKPKYINQFIDVFVDKTNILVEVLKEKEGKKIDIYNCLEKCNVDLVVETLSGYEMDTQRTPHDAPDISRAMEICMLQMFNIFYQIKPIFACTSLGKELRNIRESFFGIFHNVLHRKEEEIKNHIEDDNEKSRKVFLDILMENRGALSDSEIKDQMHTMVVAGLDTGTTVIAFTLLMVAMHPEVEEKVYREVLEVIGLDRDVEYEDLIKFTYLEKVIKETMRLFPAAPIVARSVSDDVQLETCTIPKGSEIILLYLTTHRSPKYYKDPLLFDPERFCKENIASRHPYAFVPFSGGPRICLGIRYAMMMMKTQIALLVRRYRFFTDYKSVESIRVQANMVIKPTLGYPMQVISRE